MAGPFSLERMSAVIARMEVFPATLRALVSGMDDAALRWSPSEQDWSVTEVLCHLADEEEADFPVRLRSIIETPEREWPPIDPGGWAIEREYKRQAPHAALDRFAERRAGHLPWLRSLTPGDLESVHPHPEWGPVPASLMFASWSAHDALHLRQIAKRLYALSSADVGGESPIYAGEW